MNERKEITIVTEFDIISHNGSYNQKSKIIISV